ncbi:uncharacterized protein PGTG_21009 [Puccinia graminis f. sp. tritici CRL 75-36-700-3]|uniref:Uncharacterized protein n=1 Tax=Puccinia graminis f. sp. tritici (strain CRL 75-36-700-3 / race SCCL) TaxID=418459 RepID=H6QQ30_PUCGT|nr:uncharacterized protein PGTG_21009 [Puccinia graminis f. sp. tritici CRL 75-36-700-3]EHS64658.1 hypothetical protein PGTG_21009 [Puccinia graminis f. sp. tritici CRL 75-36-700-3]
MTAYDTFLTPAELEAFEEGIFANEPNIVDTSRQDAFIDTIFDFNLFETAPPQPDNDVIEIEATLGRYTNRSAEFRHDTANATRVGRKKGPTTLRYSSF